MKKVMLGVFIIGCGRSIFAAQPTSEKNSLWELHKDAAGTCHLVTGLFANPNNQKLKYKFDFKKLNLNAQKQQKTNMLVGFGFCFTVTNIDSISVFDAGLFEGPDALAQKFKILSIKTTSKLGNEVSFFMAPAGSYTICDNDPGLAFQFEASYADKATNDSIVKLMKSLAEGVDSISVAVYSPNKPKGEPLISATCDVKPMLPFVQQFLKGCALPSASGSKLGK